MKLGRLNHIGVARPSIADSIASYRAVMGAKGAVEAIFRGRTPDAIEKTEQYEAGFATPFDAVADCVRAAQATGKAARKPLEEA